MADYEAVPRALSRLARQVREIIPMRAQAEERKARIGLAQTRQEYEIKGAEEAREHRIKVFEATQEEREQRRGERERAFEAGREPRELAKVTARRQLEELGRQKRIREEPVTHAWVMQTVGVQDAPDLINRSPYVQKGMEESFGSKLDPKSGVYQTAEGVPLRKGEVFDRPDRFNLMDIINRDWIYQAESERDNPKTKPERKAYLTKMLASPRGKERLYEKSLKFLRSIQGTHGAVMVPGQREVLKSNIKRVERKIDELRKFRMAKELTKVPATAKFTYYDRAGKPHSQFIAKEQFPEAEKAVRDQGGTMEKPEKKVKPTAAKQKAVLGLIDKYTAKGANEPTAEQAAAINDAAQEIGYEYKHVIGPIREADKRWYWWDPDKKAYWTLRRKTTKQPVMKGALGSTKPGEPYRGKIPSRRKIKRRGTLEGRKVIEYEDGEVVYAD